MRAVRIIVVGGGAAGIFAAIAAAEAHPGAAVTVLERTGALLAKVRISGGGRCNVTHACFDPRELSRRYPRGGKALIGPFHRFQPRDTVAWFEGRGVPLKTEKDGRMFPVTDSSETVIEALVEAARRAGVSLQRHCEVSAVEPTAEGGFRLELRNGETLACDRLLLATGGSRSLQMQQVLTALGHTVEPPVPSLFTFHVDEPWLHALSGVSVEAVVASVPGTKLKERGPLLITHWGLSGPAILKLSAWGARELHECDYRFTLQVDWVPALAEGAIEATFAECRSQHPAKLVVNVPVRPIPQRLWFELVTRSGIDPETRWAELPAKLQRALGQRLKRSTFAVTGKSMNKEEFVTCGGISLKEVDFKTMESRLVPGLYFAGEALDLDGITGGYNFQAAWTTGWIAGTSMAES